MRNTFTIEADIKKSNNRKNIVVTQNDSIRFIVGVFDDGIPFSLSEVSTTSLASTLPDKRTIVSNGIKVGDNTIQFDLGTNETSVPGVVRAVIQLYDSNDRVSTISFTYTVVKDPTGDGYVPSETEQTLIQVVLNDGPLVIQDAQDQANYAKAQGNYAKQVADENKTTWKTPVADYASIATTYPSPQHGDTVQTLNDGKIYRYNANSTTWEFTQEYNDTAITDLQNKLSQQNKQSVTLTHGLQVVNAEQNSPLDVSIEGRTLVNLLGNQGRVSNSANVTIDSSKYYVVVSEGDISVTVDGESKTVPYKFTGKTSVELSWSTGKVALYELSYTEYNNIGTTWDDAEVARRYPYVDSVQHVQNPYVIAEGENLLPPFTEWTAYSGKPTIEAPYKAKVDINNKLEIYRNVVPNQRYSVQGKASGSNGRLALSFFDSSGTQVSSTIIVQNVGTMKIENQLAPSNASIIRIAVLGADTTETEISNVSLTLGNQAKPFVPRNPSHLYTEVKLGALSDKKDILYRSNGDWYLRKNVEKDVKLDGTKDWLYGEDFSGFKRVSCSLNNATNDTEIVTKYNGVPLNHVTNFLSFDQSRINTRLSVTISDTDSGWGESYTPTAAEIKAYFCGWRLCDGTYGNKWTGTGTKTWYPIGDTDLNRAVTSVPTSEAPTITEGKIDYYRLSYVLASPQTINVTDKVEGGLVVNGATQVEVGSGFTYVETDGQRDYTLLGDDDRYNVTANLLSAPSTYNSSLKSVVDDVVAKQADISSTVSVHVRAIAELYKRVKALGG